MGNGSNLHIRQATTEYKNLNNGYSNCSMFLCWNTTKHAVWETTLFNLCSRVDGHSIRLWLRTQETNVTIFSNCLPVLQRRSYTDAAAAVSVGKKYIRRPSVTLNDAGGHVRILGHSDIKGNKKADELWLRLSVEDTEMQDWRRNHFVGNGPNFGRIFHHH